jgi:hypothetical protein
LTASPSAVKSSTLPDPTLPTKAIPVLAATPRGNSANSEGQFGELRSQFESGNRCFASIIRASDTLDEETHHFVANQLVHNAFIVNQHPRGCGIKLVQTLGERSGVRLLTERCRSSHVGEHNSDVDLDASGRQTIEAGLTEIRALTGGLAPQEADDLAAYAAKGGSGKACSEGRGEGDERSVVRTSGVRNPRPVELPNQLVLPLHNYGASAGGTLGQPR